ncbi:MAG: metallophosphoesterase family protein [Bryobacteraceae bacterium]
MVVGLISDTHGLLRPEAVEQLRGVDRIIHAGDVGRIEIVAALRSIAPVTAVRGNVDSGPCGMLPVRETVEVGGHRIHVIHDLDDLDPDEDAAAVIFGHTHKPVVKEVDGVLYVNPGSAGPRRFNLPISLARLTVTPEGLQAELIELAPGAPS